MGRDERYAAAQSYGVQECDATMPDQGAAADIQIKKIDL